MSEGDPGADAWTHAQSRTHELLSRLQARLDAARVSQDQIHSLLEAVLSVGRELELSQVLRRIVQEATVLVDAEYGALGVVGEDHRLSEFIPVGVDDEQWAAIGALPVGHGLLGELIRHPEPLRLAELAAHPSSYGFPPHHPQMHSFLGVPIRVRGQVFGNLYLTQKRGAREFDAEDESLLLTLAVAAGIAIENSRLYEESCRRERWLAAGSEVTNSLLSDCPRAEVMALILRRARANVSADLGLIAIPVEGAGKLRIALATGAEAERHHGSFVPMGAGYLGTSFTRAGASETTDIENDPRSRDEAVRWAGFGPAVAVAIGSGTAVRGVLLLARKKGSTPFSVEESEPLTAFARQASLAMELAERRKNAEQTAVLEDRDRIARDLHDLAIQRLFATGMTLQGAQRFVTHPQAEQRLRRAVDDLDTTIKIIRSTIFGLRTHDTGGAAPPGLRSRIAQAVEASTVPLGFAPGLRIEGLVETRVPGPLADHVVAVLVEALSNAARYATAGSIDVHLRVTSELLTLTVTDDGVGIPVGAVFSGLDNLRERARAAGGGLYIGAPDGGGTRLTWTAPVAPGAAHDRPAR
ncbi:GAF domain-containing protein [Streptomyces sp. HB132]|uniref:sensor histidine kinase n=1 Tax=Streptomyces sp. HB132 TaxID=767388 RepID=UPI00195FDA5D|nr:GAF domain-containing protein [Streptomyces sp. HB132]MBM7440245.1 signal transduction histidine kinase [Streptomyces sp. HB132]